MANSIDVLGSNMKYLQERITVISNNIANSDTDGFKRDELVGKSFNAIFSDEMAKIIPEPEKRYGAGMLQFKPGVFSDKTYTTFTQGLLQETGDRADLAVSGNGFIAVERDGQTFYTRGVRLKTNASGYLVNGQNDLIQGNNGPIQVSGDYRISEDGQVVSGGQVVATIQLMDFEDTEMLQKYGDNLYVNLGGPANSGAADGVLKQGFAESSNVDLSEEVISMMEVTRLYETNQRLIQMLDEIESLAANQIGKVR